jgi:PBSX family phage portal protein
MKFLKKSGILAADDKATVDGNMTVIKIDNKGNIETLGKQPEDQFINPMLGEIAGKTNVINPPYNLTELHRLQQLNNTLMQCITAMEINIHASGYTIVPKDPEKDLNKKQAESAKNFFDEVFPRKSYQTVRRAMARDLEATGNGYLEVIRNAAGKIIFLNHIDAKSIRLIKLENASTVQRVAVMRDGAKIQVPMTMRERRFVQVVGSQRVYFREFGASRQINKFKGFWEGEVGTAGENKPIPLDAQGTELIHFKITCDTDTPYGVPRWINQVPSVLGSRKAEEFNLNFFDSGGLPPAIIFIEGGGMTSNIRDQLNRYLKGKGSDSNQMAIVELFSTAGTLDKAGKVKVNVERFGPQDDSMFENYDVRSEERVRGAFRLPPIFAGKGDKANFATAFASYVTAETQVFLPERNEHDEIINLLILPALGLDEVEYKSNPISIKESKIELEGIKIARDGGALSIQGVIDAVNKATNLDLQAIKEGEPVATTSPRNGENPDESDDVPTEIDGATPDDGPLDRGRGVNETPPTN